VVLSERRHLLRRNRTQLLEAGRFHTRLEGLGQP
jgi:hypothetical protein